MVRGTLESFSSIVVQQARRAPFSWLAFACLLAWMFGLFWSDVFLGRVATASFDFVQVRALWLAVEAIALAALCAVLSWKQPLSSGAVAAAGSCCFVGTVLMLFAPVAWPGDIVRVGALVLSGLGSACMLADSGVRFAGEGSRRLLVNVSLALLAASILDSVLLVLPTLMQAMMVALLPVLYVCLTVLAARRRPQEDPKPATLRNAVAREGGSKLAVAVRVVMLPLAVGLAYGLMQRLTAGSYAASMPGLNGATIASFVVSALVIGVTALFFDSRKLIKAICFVAIPIVGVAYVLLPLFASSQEAAQSVGIIGFNAFYFMVWALWAGGSAGPRQARRFVLGLTVLVAAESLGSVLGLAVVDAVQASGDTLAVVSLVVVYVLLMAALFSFDRAEKQREVVAEDQQAVPNSFTTASYAERFGLSAREREVFELLAKGRNRVHISQALFISDNTTRTHMKNVYRKLDVHSQQELIDLVERERER